MASHFTAVKFKNYKAFRSYSVSLTDFNILVGPNNAGKSTAIGAFRILAEGMRRARAKSSDYIDSDAYRGLGYHVNLRDLPVSTENVFTNYDESEAATIEFRVSNGHKLKLIFPDPDVCYLVCDTGGRAIRTPSDFKRAYDLSISFVPVLGPVEHNEQLVLPETARRALLTHRASRNFRNIWYHRPEGFEQFRETVQGTWPGMDIQPPEIDRSYETPVLHMFCPEDRYPRELYWAGFGFQVWCQMLTFITKAEADSLLIVDEPDIYLHSDLQRQLVHILRERKGDVLIATHSTEIVSEAESGEIVVLNKRWNAARRLKNPAQLQALFGALGSNLNPIFTQLAKTKRVIFVEGEDFTQIAAFARKLGKHSFANRSAFAVVPAGGFNPSRVADFSNGMEQTLGVKILRAVVFDRDYRSETLVRQWSEEFGKFCEVVRIHGCKEIENFVLVPAAIERAILGRLADRNSRARTDIQFHEDVEAMLIGLTDEMKSAVFGQYNAVRTAEIRCADKGIDIATATSIVHAEFEQKWTSVEERLKIVPGKDLLSRFNTILQDRYGVTTSATTIIGAMLAQEVPTEMRQLVVDLDRFAARATE